MNLDYNKAVADGLSLFIKSPSHYKYNTCDIHTYLILPIINNRIRIFYQEDLPIGLITWCWFTENKTQKFLQYKYDPQQEDYEDTNRNPC